MPLKSIRVPNSPFGTASFTSMDVTEAVLGPTLDPFIVVALFRMSEPTFPPHPHAGFSVATYILPESEGYFWNQDSLGNREPILQGELHWTTAGRGVQHEETVGRRGVPTTGFQIWIDHAPGSRLIEPGALHLKEKDVPRYRFDGGAARVVLGRDGGLQSPLTPPTEVRLVDIELRAGGTFDHAPPDGENAFVWVLSGAVSDGAQRAGEGEVIPLDGGSEGLRLEAGDAGARLVLFGGRPLNSPRTQQGPFVLGSRSELRDAISRFAAGGFGRLAPFDQSAVEAMDARP